jgi:hypothetical protein
MATGAQHLTPGLSRCRKRRRSAAEPKLEAVGSRPKLGAVPRLTVPALAQPSWLPRALRLAPESTQDTG